MMFFTERCREETKRLQKNKSLENYIREQERVLVELEAFMLREKNENNNEN